MAKRWQGWVAGIAVALCVQQAAAGADGVSVRIVQASLSTRILLDLYQSFKNNTGGVALPNPQFFQMSVQASAATETPFQFRVEIRDKSTLVASAEPFEAPKLAAGLNTFNAGAINANHVQVYFNSGYSFNGDAGQLSQGSLLPAASYQVALIPLSPAGPAYLLPLSLFIPASALNSPPLPISPNNAEISTVLPLFVWTLVPNAAGYEVLVGSDQNPESNLYWRSGRLNTTQAMYPGAARALENGKTYFWQVRALDGFGNPIGGVDGKSQPVWFRVNSLGRVQTGVTPAEADRILRSSASDLGVWTGLQGYEPVAVESSHPDTAGLLQRLQTGQAKVTSAAVE